jgi:hypothetical protein
VARTVTPPLLPIDENEAIPEEDLPFMEIDQDRARMVDWLQCVKLPVMFALLGTILIIFAMKSPDLRGVATYVVLAALLFLGVGLFALMTQLRGIYFNGPKDSLSYPLTVFRRGVQISDVRDANCQTITKPAFHITNTIIGIVSVGQIKGLGTTKRYILNMSGEFGSRRVIFHTKYKRDQFLSLLRRFAPHVRITRWI